MEREQHCIQLLHDRLQNKQDIHDLIPDIETTFKSSVILQYYAGYYYEIVANDMNQALVYYQRCLGLNDFFTPPYFSICSYYIKIGWVSEAYKLFSIIFCKKTIDARKPGAPRVFNYEENLKICSMLGPSLIDSKQAEKLYLTLYKHTNISNVSTFIEVQGYKMLSLSIANLIVKTNPDKAVEYLMKGLKGANANKLGNFTIDQEAILQNMDKQLIQSILLYSSYSINRMDIPADTINEIYNVTVNENEIKNNLNDLNDKIRIGYISPDFNKNAVGMFLIGLLKHYDSSKFEVYCYNTNKDSDSFTDIFRNACGTNWFDINYMSDIEVYMMMKSNHKLDILVDLIGHGIGGRMDLIAMAPAKYIINYLGFPESLKLKTVTHRLTDRVTDATKKAEYNFTEEMLFMPRTFLCWQKFDNINDVEINYKPSDNENKIYIGILNKVAKHHVFIRNVWSKILKVKKNAVLCLKLGQGETEKEVLELYNGIPREQIKFLPFVETLEEYYQLFNEIDFCLDTHPYSGTTTSCSSFYMGVPTFTLYNKKNIHVNNVTGGLLLNLYKQTDNEYYKKFVCYSEEEYIKKVCGFKIQKNEQNHLRTKMRKDFLELMDPTQFMQEYQALLTNLINNN